MNAAGAAPGPDDTPALIFQWERRSRARWRLAGVLALSLLAHAASLYILQVAYTPTGSLLPPPARVTLAPLDDSPENASLARWLALADPALLTQPPVPPVADVINSLGFRYIPSYKAAPPPFKPLESTAEAVSVTPPRPRPPGPVPSNVLPVEILLPANPSPAGGPTRLILTGDIAPLVSSPLPPVRFTADPASKPLDQKSLLDPTVFLVGVRAEGGAPFLFRQSKAGEAGTDEFARDYLARLPFHTPAAAPGTVIWGWAEFRWGLDAYRREESKR